MPLTISGSTGIAGVDGSASTPAVQGTDTNTGIVFPAADTVTVATGGTERMRVDSSGNVGIGTSSPGYKLDVSGSGTQTVHSITTDTSGANIGRFRAEYTGGGGGTASAIDMRAGDNYTYLLTQSNTPMLFGTNDIERMRLDTSGNLQFNSGYGSVATAYGCRAWVNFNGDGTIAIRASAGVTSLTDNGTGQYTINLSFTMPDSNYAVVGSAGSTNNAIGDRQLSTYPVNTTSCKVVSGQTASTNVYDATQVHVAVFR